MSQRLKLHFIGICGKGMAPIAVALARQGWQVTGSDQGCYAPMSDYLDEAGIKYATPYHPDNIPKDTDLVVVGKRVHEDNPELQGMIQMGFPHCSYPQFLNRHLLHHSRNAVIAGALGKTTTTSMLAWIMEHAGLGPNYFIGGVTRNFKESARLQDDAAVAVLEGDEYASCFDDLSPKFLHYRPELALITNVLEDHPDLYDGVEKLQAVFLQLVKLLPAAGALILSDDDGNAAVLKEAASCKVMTVGFTDNATHQVDQLNLSEKDSSFKMAGVAFTLPMFGCMNVKNAAMAALAASHFGISFEESARALQEFRGIQNRQDDQVLGSNTVVTDKATHPVALREFFASLRQQYPARRLVSVFQPRGTGGENWIYQKQLPDALGSVDHVILTEPYEHLATGRQRWSSQKFNFDRLQRDLQELGVSFSILDQENMHVSLGGCIREGDVVCLSLLEQSISLRGKIRQALASMVHAHPKCSSMVAA